MLVFKIGWRNIWRNWRRSIITIAAITFAAFMMVIMRGMQLGTYAANIKSAIESFSGYLQVQNKGYLDNPSLQKSFVFDNNLKDLLQKDKRIKAFSPRIISECLIGNEKNSVGAAIFAVDATTEKQVSTIYKRVRHGKFISDERINDIVVGEQMLKNLKLNIGDDVVILTNCYDGSMGNMKFRISGTVKMGSASFDAMSVIMNIKVADRLLAMNGKVSSVVVSINNMDDLDDVKTQLISGIKSSNQKKLTVRDWIELMPEFEQTIQFDNISGIIFLGILVLIVAFGILNTVIMSITERFKEFGVMLALGAKNFMIITAVFIETVLMSVIGILLGMLCGYLVNSYLILHPIQFGEDMAKLYEEFGFIPELHSTVEPAIFITTALTILIVVLIVYIIPAYKISKLEALKGIRYV